MDTQILEAQILYSVIFTPEWIDDLVSILEQIDFPIYGDIFDLIVKFHNEGKTIDYTVIKALTPRIDALILDATMEDKMGLTIIPNKKIFEERMDLLKELSAKKQIGEARVNELDLNLLKLKLEKIYKKGLSRWLTGNDIKNLASEIYQMKKENTVIYGISILDKATKGLDKSQYAIVAGRPSVGKSSFLQFIGLTNAEKGKRVLFVSAEMSEDMIVSRILKTYQPTTIPQNFNILIAADVGTIEAEIARKARDFDLVLVDYIQLLKPKAKTRDMYERVTNLSSELKQMATRFNIPIVCASQFSRRAEGRQPSMADLKESGALEQDADVVISLWKDRDSEDLIDENKEKIKIDLLKNRNGWTFINSSTKTYEIMFKKNEFRFYEIDTTVSL